MKTHYISALLALLLIAGCSTAPVVIEQGNGLYMIMGEAEFDYTGMAADIYAKANAKCDSMNKDMVVKDTHTGYGSIGALGSKRGLQVYFSCQ